MISIGNFVLVSFILKISLLIYFVVVAHSFDGNYDNNDSTDNLVIEINSGRIRGSVMQSWKGNNFFGFRGIRYGKPPIGDLRYQAPVPVEPWDNVFDATLDGPMCPQAFQPESAISEDCLRLNVYTIKAPTLGKHQNLQPVLVYIHGGSYHVGSGTSTHEAGPQYLMDSGEIVLVTINYRLGALGFLSFGTKETPGNAGLKDQVLALKWVRENIENFGGDSNSVTILGSSSGAFSNVLHMISPMSKGLFHKVILMSGGVTFQNEIPSHQSNLGIRQAKLLNCTNIETIDKVYDCLKTADANVMAQTLLEMFEFGLDNPLQLWDAVIENDFGQERFLTENPQDALLKGNFSHIPIMAGITKDELAIAAVHIVTNEFYLKQLDENYEINFPICFLYESNTTRSREISNAVWNAYNLSHPLTKEFLPSISNIYSDFLISYPLKRVLQILERTTDIYYYQFSYQGRYSNLYYPDEDPYGVVHSDDSFYLFVQVFAPMFNFTDPEAEMVEKMTIMWTEFVKTGNPNIKNDKEIGNIFWPIYRHDTAFYLDINSEMFVGNHLNENRYRFYDNLFPLPKWNPYYHSSEAPVPAEPWDDIYDASNDGPICPQPLKPQSEISEDCLRLNVYTKYLPTDGDKQKLKPVLFYIPGGAFFGGAVSYGQPQYLLDTDEIVLVAISYRLGTLGFLSLGIREAPGNAGLKDQVLALKWVKENIAKFGGDYNSVTIIGNSAGGYSNALHMISPMSKGLFHKVIIASSVALNQKLQSEQAYLGVKQAKILNCTNIETLKKVYDCLKTADAKIMTDNFNSFVEFGADHPRRIWNAVIERDFGQERFLIEDPFESLLKGNFSQIPIIAGITKNELATSAVDIIKNENYLRDFDENYETIFPICFLYESNTTRSKEISNAVWNAYNLSHPLTKEFLPNINMLFSDFLVGYTTKRVIDIAERTTNVYYYQFSYQGKYSRLYYPDDKPYGVEHADDLFYIFLRPFAPMFNVSDLEAEMVEKMTRMWIQFIKTGNPNNPNDEVIGNIKWPLYKKDSASYLDIISQPIIGNHLNENRYKIYDQLFPLNY